MAIENTLKTIMMELSALADRCYIARDYDSLDRVLNALANKLDAKTYAEYETEMKKLNELYEKKTKEIEKKYNEEMKTDQVKAKENSDKANEDAYIIRIETRYQYLQDILRTIY